MSGQDIIPHLFRTEFSKLVALLTRTFGIENLDIAEDIASETFLSAMETWPCKGIPENPTAWLYTVAKNKLKNYFLRNQNFKTKIKNKIKETENPFDEIHIDLSDKNISDSQLQMLFTICHPAISVEAQICLALRILCGLGLNEIADALLTNKETIHKRLQRAKVKLYSENIEIAMPKLEQLDKRLDVVLQTIYLLYSEGYYSESNNTIIRKELCLEALNLAYLLLGNPLTNNHSTNSLLSLMCFHSSRLEARLSENGNMILYEDQDRKLWDTELIERGFYYLQQASKWEITSNYYLEASIAYWHTVGSENQDKWPSILSLYDALSTIDHSPIVALNRIYALSKVQGNLAAIHEAEKLNLKTNHFYFLVLAELYKQIDLDKTIECLQTAFNLCKTFTEKEMIDKQIKRLSKKPTA